MFDKKLFKELDIEEFEEADMATPLVRVWRSRWWWYNWFSRKMRRHTNFWGSEANTYGMKNHKASYNTKISNATLKVFGRFNCPVDSEYNNREACGTNQRIHKINKYNKYGVNKQLSVFNTKQ